MNLRVLIYSNPLVVDKIGKTFQFWKDSGFIYTKQLVKSLPKEWRFYWCVPDKIKKPEELAWFTESNENVELIPYPYSTSIHQNRYNFSLNTLSKYFSYGYDIDVILNNQPEVSANLRAWAANQRRDIPIIFSFYHWIDCAESSPFGKSLSGYIYRQIDGAENSDYIMFHNEYAYNLFQRETDNIMKDKDFSNKVRFFHPSSTKFTPVPFDLEVPEDKKIILFNHRLNETTRWREVVEIMDKIYKERQDFVLWVTDDSKLKEFEYLKSKPYIKVKSLQDGEYGYVLSKAHFSICNHRGYSTWNMAVIDSIANRCLALIPNREVYQSMFKNSIRHFGRDFAHDGNLKQMIISKLNCHVTTNRETAMLITLEDEDLFHFLDGEDIKWLVEESINAEMSKKDCPAKYDEVLKYIKSNQHVRKKDWINEFWSFHVNSNFRTIRRKLLLEKDICDNTASSETIYQFCP